jgi:hypothetical protein
MWNFISDRDYPTNVLDRPGEIEAIHREVIPVDIEANSKFTSLL